MPQTRVPLGRVVMTAHAAGVLNPADVAAALARHAAGDWGEVCPDDRDANERALETGLRFLSVYSAADGRNFWIITESDRSVTTVLLPEDH
jgi:hypothetical protein